jgi:carboxypeptidase T
LEAAGSARDIDITWEAPSAGGYHSYRSLDEEFGEYASKYPGRVEKLSVGKSFEGRELWALKIGTAGSTPLAKVAVVGGHHAREWASVEIPIRFVEDVLTSTEARLSDLVNGIEFWVLPMVNPDGHTFSVDYRRGWRKSRSPHRDSGGILRYGVDLNRNYPVGFRSGMTSDVVDNATYGGPWPFSEPETNSLGNLCKEQKFSGIISFHTFGDEILYPWAHLPPSRTGAEIDVVRDVARRMAEAINQGDKVYNAIQAYGHYDLEVGGDLCDWVFKELGGIAITVELEAGNYGFTPPSTELGNIYDQFRPGLWYFMYAATQCGEKIKTSKGRN